MIDYVFTRNLNKFHFINPDPETILIEDIAWGLSHQCRFNGHTRKFYSIAEHCVHVSKLCEDPMWGLLHDAAEAYLGDMVNPVKQLFPGFIELEDDLLERIVTKFGLDPVMPETVKFIDAAVCVHEAHILLAETIPGPTCEVDLQCWNPEQARIEFLTRFNQLKVES